MALGVLHRRDRIASALGVAAVHALIGWALVQGLTARFETSEQARLAMFDIAAVPPPPPAEAAPDRAADPREEGAAAPPALEAVPKPVVAPPVVLPQPVPIIAPPIARDGAAAAAGAAPLPGPGTGEGGVGTGTGSGLGGEGQGGGGGGTRAAKLSGAILDRDYPRAARRGRHQGSVTVRFTVGADGRPRDCAVAVSSGHAELDATTCRLIEARFRYRPARNVGGEAVAELRGWRQDWWLERRGR